MNIPFSKTRINRVIPPVYKTSYFPNPNRYPLPSQEIKRV
jgi:hypothetical protein